MAPLYGGLEASEYAVVAIATGGRAGGGGTGPTALSDGGFIAGFAQGGGALSALVSRSAILPTNVTLPSAFAPLVTGASYSQASRSVSVGTNWSDVAASTQLVRVALVGSQQRAFIYASPTAIANGLVVPVPPSGVSYDPAGDPNVQGSLVAITLPAGSTVDSMAALSGPTLQNLSATLVGFTRTPLQ